MSGSNNIKNINFIILLLLTVLILLRLPAKTEETLKATITETWSVDSARVEAFKNIEYEKDLSGFPAIDPNLIENRVARTEKEDHIANRELTYFENGEYGVRILTDVLFDKAFFYDASGKLESVGYHVFPAKIKTAEQYIEDKKNKKIYPIKGYLYLYPDGELLKVNLTVSYGDSYVFDIDGSIEFHWVGLNCYDLDGNIVNKRGKEPL